MRAVFTFLCAASLCAFSLAFGANELSNRRAPGFSLPDSQLKRFDLLDYRGKWVLIDFMKSDCPHCMALAKILEQVQSKYGSGKVAVFEILIAPPENQATAAKFKAESKSTATILFDQGQMTASYFNMTPAHPSFDTPHLFVVDPQGMIVRDWGYSDQTKDILEGKGLIAELEGAMAGKK
jgi:peroxiredoxin